MSSPKPDGGAAFPFFHQFTSGEFQLSHGMTLREWYAGQALAGILAAPGAAQSLYRADEGSLPLMARDVWAIADAMITARQS